MPYKDPHSEKAKESKRNYRERNKEKIKEKQKEYRERNKEKILKKDREYRERNREEILKKNKTDPQRIKSRRINNWKAYGVIGDLDKLYEYYLSVPKCEACDVIFEDTFYRCLDHDHETGVFRKVVCRSCNNMDSYLKKLK